MTTILTLYDLRCPRRGRREFITEEVSPSPAQTTKADSVETPCEDRP